MTRRYLLLVLMLCMLLRAASAERFPLSFTDSTGETITLDHRPQRAAVLFSSYAEIWQLAGGAVAITVGESVERGFAGADAVLVDEGAGKTIHLEQLLAAQPDFVIGSADIAAQADACRLMNKAGIPAALFRVDTFPQYLDMLSICASITGNEDAFALHGTAVQKCIDALMHEVEAADTPKQDVLFIRAGSRYSATKAKRAPDHFACIMLDELGAHNIANEAKVLLDGLSLEEILLRDPDHIFLTTMGDEEAAKGYIADLFAQDGWRSLSAVKNGRYTYLPRDLFHFKPTARWAEAYELLAHILYPELNH